MTRFLGAVPAHPVSDERRAARFLADALGLEEFIGADGHGLGILVRDAVQIHGWVGDGRAEGAERQLAGSASCRIAVEGVADLYDHCTSLGVVHPSAHLRHQPWGVDEFGILDPDGNLITLYENIPSAG